jgi:hypothetical protein
LKTSVFTKYLQIILKEETLYSVVKVKVTPVLKHQAIKNGKLDISTRHKFVIIFTPVAFNIGKSHNFLSTGQ